MQFVSQGGIAPQTSYPAQGLQPSASRHVLGLEPTAAYAPHEASSFAPPFGHAGSFVPPASARAGSQDMAAHANQIFNPPHLQPVAAISHRTRSPAKPRLSGHASPGMMPPTGSPRDDHLHGLVSFTSMAAAGQGVRSVSPLPQAGPLTQRIHGGASALGHASDRHSASPAVRHLEQGRVQDGRRHWTGDRTACGAPRTPLVASREVKKRPQAERPNAGAWRSAAVSSQQPTMEADVAVEESSKVASSATTMASEMDGELTSRSQQHFRQKLPDFKEAQELLRPRGMVADEPKTISEPRKSCSSEETIPESRDCVDCGISVNLDEERSKVPEHLLQRERDVAGREKILLDREDQVEALKLDLQNQQKRIEDEKRRLQEQEDKFREQEDKLREQAASREAELAKAERRMEDWQRRLQEHEDKLRDRDEQTASREARLADRETEMARREAANEAELRKGEGRLADREAEMARREACCYARELEVQSRDLDTQRQAHRLQEEDDRIKETKRQLDEREHRWFEAHRDRDGVMLPHTGRGARMSPRGKENYALQRQLEEQREMVHQIKRKNNSWSPEDGMPAEDASMDNLSPEAASPDPVY